MPVQHALTDLTWPVSLHSASGPSECSKRLGLGLRCPNVACASDDSSTCYKSINESALTARNAMHVQNTAIVSSRYISRRHVQHYDACAAWHGNPSCMPNWKSLASAFAQILKGNPEILGLYYRLLDRRCILWWALANPRSVPILKSLVSAIAGILMAYKYSFDTSNVTQTTDCDWAMRSMYAYAPNSCILDINTSDQAMWLYSTNEITPPHRLV